MNLSKITSHVAEAIKSIGSKKTKNIKEQVIEITGNTAEKITKSLDCLSNSAKASVKNMDVKKQPKPFAKLTHDLTVDSEVAAAAIKNGSYNKVQTSPVQYEALKKVVMDSPENGVVDGVKSAKESFGVFNAAIENEFLKSQLAHKSAEESAKALIESPKMQQQWYKEELLEKYGEKLAKKQAESRRKAELMAKYGHKLVK